MEEKELKTLNGWQSALLLVLIIACGSVRGAEGGRPNDRAVPVVADYLRLLRSV